MIIVRGNKLEFNGKTYKCAVGKNGFAVDKIEGDNCSPIGEFSLRKVLYRADKIAKPKTGLAVEVISKNDGWCDAPDDVKYNLPVQLSYPARHENLWRDDDVYDVIIPLGYNDDPVISGKGSAIFMHVARENYQGTEGCIALKLVDLLEVLQGVDATTKIDIKP